MTLSVVSARRLRPEEVVFGGIWIGPGGGDRGDGCRPDPGQAAANAAVRAAVAAGIVEFDTAPWYGAGACEERLGRALHEEGLVNSVRVFTKAGRLYSEPVDGTPSGPGFDAEGRPPLRDRVCTNDYTAAGAEASLAQSLARMGLSAVHGLRIHDPNDNSNNRLGDPGSVDEVALALDGELGMCAGLRRLRERGAVAHVGLGMNCNAEAHQGVPGEVLRLLRGCEPGTFDSALLAGGWNLLSQAGLECLLECERRGVAVYVAGVFCSGLLASEGGTYAYRPAPGPVLDRARRWRELAARHGRSLQAVAIAFAALPACVSRVVLGMATEEQVGQNAAWLEESGRVPAAVWADARAEGLLDAAVPTPAL